MNELVLTKPLGSKLEPYTTIDIIAEYAGITHKAANQLARRHEKDLELFGTVEFEMEACPHKTGASVRKIYHLNKQQATLFITYLQNTPPVRAFKKRLVQEFFSMREELTRRQVLRQVGKTAPLLRKKRGAGKDARAVDFLTAEELAAVTAKDAQVCAMLDAGMIYEKIRSVLLRGGEGHAKNANN